MKIFVAILTSVEQDSKANLFSVPKNNPIDTECPQVFLIQSLFLEACFTILACLLLWKNFFLFKVENLRTQMLAYRSSSFALTSFLSTYPHHEKGESSLTFSRRDSLEQTVSAELTKLESRIEVTGVPRYKAMSSLFFSVC